jgi:hypothetical protein
MDALRKDIPITVLYGSRSWVDNGSGELIREKHPDSYVNVQVYLPQFIKTNLCSVATGTQKNKEITK